MPHTSRSNRKRNALRKKNAEIRRENPLPLAKQLERAAASAAAHLRRYPVPPKYRYSYDDSPPVQPLCYEVPLLLPPLRLRRI